MRGFTVEDFLRFRIGAGICHFVRLHLNARLVARRNAHVPAWIENLNRRIRGYRLRVGWLIQVMLRQTPEVEEVIVAVPAAHPWPHMVPSRRTKAQECDQEQDSHKTA